LNIRFKIDNELSITLGNSAQRMDGYPLIFITYSSSLAWK